MADKERESGHMTASERAVQAENGQAGGSPTGPAQRTQNRRAQHKAIAHGLRQFFDTVASEPVPDEFLNLLKRMDAGGPLPNPTEKKDSEA